MRIACPSCSAAYEVPDAALHAGRVVRCARCGTDWTPLEAIPPPDPGPEPQPEPEPEPAVAPTPPPVMALADDPPPAPAAAVPVVIPTRRRPWLALAWVFSVAAVVVALGLLVTARDRVMTAWSPAIRAYAALGLTKARLLPPPLAGESRGEGGHKPLKTD